jgi:hypothetical protein
MNTNKKLLAKYNLLLSIDSIIKKNKITSCRELIKLVKCDTRVISFLYSNKIIIKEFIPSTEINNKNYSVIIWNDKIPPSMALASALVEYTNKNYQDKKQAALNKKKELKEAEENSTKDSYKYYSFFFNLIKFKIKSK